MPLTPSWRWLSPLEARIVRHLAEQGSRTASEITDALNESATGKARYVLSNLVDRQILSSSNDGFSLVVPEGANHGEYRAALIAYLDRIAAE